jgi:hypothetical protein
MSGNRWTTVDPALFVEKADGSCDLPKLTEKDTKKKRLKYGNTMVHDPYYGWFDSRGEHERWYKLLRMEEYGLISELKRQVPYVLCDAEVINGLQLHKIAYKADFQYMEDGQLIVEDYKSSYTVKLKEWRLKKALFVSRYPDIVLREEIK